MAKPKVPSDPLATGPGKPDKLGFDRRLDLTTRQQYFNQEDQVKIF